MLHRPSEVRVHVQARPGLAKEAGPTTQSPTSTQQTKATMGKREESQTSNTEAKREAAQTGVRKERHRQSVHQQANSPKGYHAQAEMLRQNKSIKQAAPPKKHTHKEEEKGPQTKWLIRVSAMSQL